MNWLPLVLAVDEGEPPGGRMLWQLAPFLLMFFVMAIMMGRSSSRQRKEQAAMLATLKKNDKVVTSAGIIGIVVAIKDGEDEVTLRVDETTNSRVRILRSTIVRITSEEQQKALAAAAAATTENKT